MNSITGVKHLDCTGCMACGDVCFKEAISFEINAKDGFWYPTVDMDKCINCGACYRKCPAVNQNRRNDPELACFGAKSKNDNIRYNSTSGGFFSELAEKWCSDGGVCVGAEYDDNNTIIHKVEEEKSGIASLRQSKYAQSNCFGIYKKVKEYLESGTKVLFCGTPCQVAALNLFLGKKYPQLLTVDFVCCGICSPVVYRKYLDWLEKKYKSKVKKVWFKNKTFGWRQIGTKVDFENGKSYLRPGSRDPFMIAFVTDALSMRESCENCKYRNLPHISDLTIADFWGVEKINAEIDDNKGISAIVVNSEEGAKAFNDICSELDYFKTTAEEISAGNFTVYQSKKASPYREEFLKTVMQSDFGTAIHQYSSYSGLKKVKTDIKFYKSHLKKMIKARINGG